MQPFVRSFCQIFGFLVTDAESNWSAKAAKRIRAFFVLASPSIHQSVNPSIRGRQSDSSETANPSIRQSINPSIRQSYQSLSGARRTPPDTVGHSDTPRTSNAGHTGHMSSDTSDTSDICPRTHLRTLPGHCSDTVGHTGHIGQPGLRRMYDVCMYY